MAATLTKAMLDDLHKGNASISILPYPKGGVALGGLDFSNADQIFSIQDSFTLAPDDGDTSEIRIDQMREVIDFDFTEGAWNFQANIPSFATAVLDYFFEAGAAIEAGDSGAGVVKGPDGASYTGKGYKTSKAVDVSVLIVSESKKSALVIGHVKMQANPPAHDDSSSPDYIGIRGQVLVNAGGDRFAVLSQA